MKLEIGGGLRVEDGWENVDPIHGSRPEFRRPVQDGISLPDCYVNQIRASHVLEHIPAGHTRINAMNEMHRVLTPGGTLDIIVPLIGYTDSAGHGHTISGWQAFADPTHVSFWWFPESLLYFCDSPFRPAADYSIRLWTLDDDWHVDGGWEGHAVLRKP